MSASTRSPRRVKSTLVQTETKTTAPPLPAEPKRPWYKTTWALAFASGLALWLPLSPLNLSALGWIAPLGWLLLIREEKLSGKRPYGVIYLAGLLHWLLVLEGIRKAYWALHFGWLALAAYLAVYIVLFVGLSRIAVHRLRVPLCVAAPLVWVGLELVRGYAVTGFSAGLLGHTQSGLTSLIQIADLGGAYAVSFVVMFIAAAVAQSLPLSQQRWQPWPLAAAAALLITTFGYGQWRLSDAAHYEQAAAGKALNVTLLQNSVDTIFGVPEDRHVETFRTYLNQAADAASDHPDSQVMIWPESAFGSKYPHIIADSDAAPPADSPWTDADLQRFLAFEQARFDAHAKTAVQRINGRSSGGGAKQSRPQIVGTISYQFRKDRVDTYNSALLLSPEGKVLNRYHKMHLVMFGEYIPLGEWFPFIYKLTPMAAGLSRGTESVAFDVDGYKLSPCICFESTVPHFIRRQINELDARGESPDMLVCITNDGWFWGSGILDLHYKCAIFRAVENRRPMLVAANTGFSTAVDPAGRVMAVGPRREAQTLNVAMPAYRMPSFYTQHGDVLAGICLAFTCAFAVAGCWGRFGRQTPVG